ncbi:C-type lectin (CTL) or carbohydrate-recognition domain containing protein [Aureococcus anophagefferens]|nr:C-type lectin (CTL) or carbohydrate-recognition domain containing protein [Aureococcus anophagefferens]
MTKVAPEPAVAPVASARGGYQIPAEATAKLKEAKKAGHTARLRISLVAGGLGSVLFLYFIASIIFFPVSSDAQWVGVCCWPPGTLGLMLAVLPTDRRAIYNTARFILFLMPFCAYAATSLAWYYTPGQRGGRDCVDKAPRWICATDAPRAGACAPPSRDHAAASLRLGARLGLDLPPDLLAFGVLASRPSFRQKAHAMLMARGGQIASAAGVAALLGGNDVETVKATAQKKFFGVDMSRVELAHIASPHPDPELFKLAQKASFDQVDWFVSHSWRDDADAKFSALQNARTSFRDAHKREPIIWVDKRRAASRG